MQLKDIRVFVCVPAVGKTYLTNIDNRFVDMDAQKCRYKYGMENATAQQIEFLKGNRGEPVRQDVTEYIHNLTNQLLKNTNKILLFAPNPQIVDMLYKNNIPYCLVYHSKDCVPEIIERMKKRGNQDNFIKSMTDPIDEFYEKSVTDKRPVFKIELFKGEYLADKLLEILK